MNVELEFHNNYPGTLGYKTHIKYYPARYSVGHGYKENRRIVYAFKEGLHDPLVDKLFIDSVNELKETTHVSSYYLAPVPASTSIKTFNRFNRLIQRISSGAHVNDGFDLLQVNNDREEIHKGNSRRYDRVLDCINFNPNIMGRHIILIDDVVTTGRSYNLISSHLLGLGAASVRGIMLAKTHWSDDTKHEVIILQEGVLPGEPPPDVPPDLEFREPIDDFI